MKLSATGAGDKEPDMEIYEIRTRTRDGGTRTIRVAAESGPKAIAIARGANHRVVGGSRLAKIQGGPVTYTQRSQ